MRYQLAVCVFIIIPNTYTPRSSFLCPFFIALMEKISLRTGCKVLIRSGVTAMLIVLYYADPIPRERFQRK